MRGRASFRPSDARAGAEGSTHGPGVQGLFAGIRTVAPALLVWAAGMLRTPVVELPPEAPSGEDPDAVPSSPHPARAPGRGAASHARARRLRRLAGLAVLITPTFWV